MCSSLGVSRSAYFQWRHHPKSERDEADQAMTIRIRNLHAQSRGTYGSPRVHRDLRAAGVLVGRKRVERLMRTAEIRGLPRRRYVVTTTSDQRLPVAPNLLKQDFRASGPNRRWVGDITYISTHQGWLYLAVVMDLYSRRIVGWSMKDDLSTGLALGALELALSTRAPAKGLIHHSDRGCQYASQSYRQRLAAHGIIPSMSRRACCYDNAAMESFFHTLKVELVRGRVFLTRELARTAIFEYIAVFYNRRRRHSAIGYATPEQFEQQDVPAA